MVEIHIHLVERIVKHTLEILYLLTGEDYMVVRKTSSGGPSPASQGWSRTRESTSHMKNDCEAVLDITRKITELLTGEVPLRCEDVAVNLSMDEREYLEEHQELYKEAMMEDKKLLPLLDTSSIKKEDDECLDPFYSQDSKTEIQIPHHYQGKTLAGCETQICKTAGDPEVKGGERCKEEDIPLEIKEHQELYKEAMMEDQKLLPLLDRSSIKNEDDDPLYSQDSTQEIQIPHHYQGKALAGCETQICKTEVMGDEQCKEEDIPLEIGTDGQYYGNAVEERPVDFLYSEIKEDIKEDLPAEIKIIPNLHFVDSGTACGNSTHFQCSECNKCFSKSEELLSHQKSHKREKPHSFSCSVCGQRFFFKSQFVRHERVHTGEKPFSCAVCGKCFSMKAHLTTHERTHTGEKPYSCPECGKCFSSTSHVMRHRNVHTGEKQFSCSECGKCFSYKSTLNTHKRMHSGEKLFSCSTCGKSFPSNSYLIAHKRVHTGEKPYSCSECGKSFAKKFSLNSHVASHR